MRFALGIDVGSQSIKGVLLDADGVSRGSESYALTMTHPRGGWAEQNPRDFEEGIASVISDLLTNTGVARNDVSVLSLACQVDGVVPLSRSGDAVGPAIIWLDRRAEVQAKAMSEKIGRDRLFDITGLVPDASHPGPKILWLRDNDSETFSAAMAFPPVAGYLLHRLTGRLALDHANASSSMLYDLRLRRWSSELLNAFDLRENQLGSILDADEVAGTLSQRAAKAIGLSTTCSVLVGTGDEHAASIGAGAISEGVITDVTGTAEPVTVASKKLVLDAGGLVETHAHALSGHYLVENPGFVSGGEHQVVRRRRSRSESINIFRARRSSSPGIGRRSFSPCALWRNDPNVERPDARRLCRTRDAPHVAHVGSRHPRGLRLCPARRHRPLRRARSRPRRDPSGRWRSGERDVDAD